MSAFSKYQNGEIPHIHLSSNSEENAFLDGLNYQATRIAKNLQNFFPEKSTAEIKKMMFYKDNCLEEE